MNAYQASTKRLKLTPKRAAISLFTGAFASKLRGSGIELSNLREYIPGDDTRSIDWNATARLAKPFVREFRESKEQHVLFAVDVSSSMSVSLAANTKVNSAVDAMHLMSRAAFAAGDKVGLICFDSVIRSRLPFARGNAHLRNVLNTADSLFHTKTHQQEDPTELKSVLLNGIKKRTLCLFISDLAYYTPETYNAFRAINKKHELIIFHIVEPLPKMVLPSIGLSVLDSETGIEENFSLRNFGTDQQSKQTARLTKISKDMKRSSIAYCRLNPNGNLIGQLLTYFEEYKRS